MSEFRWVSESYLNVQIHVCTRAAVETDRNFISITTGAAVYVPNDGTAPFFTIRKDNGAWLPKYPFPFGTTLEDAKEAIENMLRMGMDKETS